MPGHRKTSHPGRSFDFNVHCRGSTRLTFTYRSCNNVLSPGHPCSPDGSSELPPSPSSPLTPEHHDPPNPDDPLRPTPGAPPAGSTTTGRISESKNIGFLMVERGGRKLGIARFPRRCFIRMHSCITYFSMRASFVVGEFGSETGCYV